MIKLEGRGAKMEDIELNHLEELKAKIEKYFLEFKGNYK